MKNITINSKYNNALLGNVEYLINLIDEINYQIDPYEYNDNFSTREDGLEYASNLLSSPKHINDAIIWYKNYLEELDDKTNKISKSVIYIIDNLKQLV